MRGVKRKAVRGNDDHKLPGEDVEAVTGVRGRIRRKPVRGYSHAEVMPQVCSICSS
jgi:hypothetical protein